MSFVVRLAALFIVCISTINVSALEHRLMAETGLAAGASQFRPRGTFGTLEIRGGCGCGNGCNSCGVGEKLQQCLCKCIPGTAGSLCNGGTGSDGETTHHTLRLSISLLTLELIEPDPCSCGDMCKGCSSSSAGSKCKSNCSYLFCGGEDQCKGCSPGVELDTCKEAYGLNAPPCSCDNQCVSIGQTRKA